MYNGSPNPTDYIKRNLNDPIFQALVFNDETQFQMFNSPEAKRAEKKLQDILKKARDKKLKRRGSILILKENNDLLADDSINYGNFINIEKRMKNKEYQQLENSIRTNKEQSMSQYDKNSRVKSGDALEDSLVSPLREYMKSTPVKDDFLDTKNNGKYPSSRKLDEISEKKNNMESSMNNVSIRHNNQSVVFNSEASVEMSGSKGKNKMGSNYNKNHISNNSSSLSDSEDANGNDYPKQRGFNKKRTLKNMMNQYKDIKKKTINEHQ
jgi:hypothetical protein